MCCPAKLIHKVRFYFMILFKEKGEILLLKFAAELEEFGKAESMPELEGKRMIVYISPKKKK